MAGARPNFMKIAPLVRALCGAGHRVEIVHTGQHYDATMSDAFFADLELPPPDFFLGVGSASHAQQTARIMEAFEPVLERSHPDWLVVVGDVNSTLACALVAAKLRGAIGTRIAHVEAGLRSNDWRMPEEVNRVLTDRLADLLLAPSADALPNLAREGLESDRVRVVGNLMIDTLLSHLPRAREAAVPARLALRNRRYAVMTLHRPSNVDERESLEIVLQAAGELAREMPIVFPVHPRTSKQAAAFGLEALLSKLTVVEPLGYVHMLSLLDSATVAITDSGGVQEETTVLGVPCVTLREQTERPITIVEGTNRMAPWPLTVEGITNAARSAAATPRLQVGAKAPVGWDGRASERVVRALEEFGAS